MSTNTLLTVDDYVKLSAVAPVAHLPYGSDAEQFGELYLPQEAGPHPVVLLLHGGCWRAQYGLAPLGNLCRAFTQLGCAVWNLEYRRLGNGGGWPATFYDVATGADHLRQIAYPYGLDLTRIVTVGHSAGGHLALWLAARHRLPASSLLATSNPLPIRGVVSLAGIPDLAVAVAQTICRGAPQELLDALPDQAPERYELASPSALLPLGVPQRLILGLRDHVVPVDVTAQYVAAARHAGDDAQLLTLPDAGHFEIVFPDTFAWAMVKEAVLALL